MASPLEQVTDGAYIQTLKIQFRTLQHICLHKAVTLAFRVAPSKILSKYIIVSSNKK